MEITGINRGYLMVPMKRLPSSINYYLALHILKTSLFSNVSSLPLYRYRFDKGKQIQELPLCSLKYLCILKLIHKGYGKDYSRYGIEKSKVIIC